MNVLVIVKGLGMGGAERLLVDQACVAPPDVTVTVAYVRSDKTHYVADLDAAGVHGVDLGAGRGPWPVELARQLKRLRPDVVHSHSPLPAAVARTLVGAGFAGRGAVHVTTEHNRWQSHRWPTRLVNAATLPLDVATWSVSEEARGSVWPTWNRRRVTTLHHGISLDRVRAQVQPLDVDPGASPMVTFIQVANRRPNKAHETGLAAFARAAAERADVRLVLVGQWLDTPEFQRLVAAHPARDRIDVLGARTDVPQLISDADVLFLSSDHEGLPVVVMEALALGRPVVSTAVGGVPEAVRDGVEGRLAPRGDADALAEAMVAVAADPALRARLGRAALERAEIFDASVAQSVQADVYRAVARS